VVKKLRRVVLGTTYAQARDIAHSHLTL